MARHKAQHNEPIADAGEVSEVTVRKAAYTVAKPFSDNPTIQPNRALANRYAIGDDVSGMDSARLESLIKQGYVTKK